MVARRLDESAHGVFVISVTPFAEDGSLDFASVDSLVDFYLGCGVHGLTILGVMGEAQKLTADEAAQFTDRILRRVAGQVPVIVGVTNPGLPALKVLADQAMASGAAGVMVAPQPGLLGDEAVAAYLGRVFDLLGPEIPVCVQDYPPANGIFIAPEVVARLIDERPQFVLFKHEDCPGLAKLSRVRGLANGEAHRRISILTGNGGLYFPLELARGCDGAMTGFAYPDMLVQVYQNFVAGDRDGAEDLFDQYLPLVRYEQQPNFGLAIRKEILRQRGAIASAFVRPPGPRAGVAELSEIDRFLSRIREGADVDAA